MLHNVIDRIKKLIWVEGKGIRLVLGAIYLGC
jgi:hypothetical protein